jgi:hypothetical protein
LRQPCRPVLSILVLTALLAPHPSLAAEATLLYQSLPLPGAPSALVAADVDGDGRQDLAVAVAVTRWDQISVEESTTMDDVEGLVEVLTVIPALLERRELRVYLGRPGGFAPEPLALALDGSVLSLEAGPPGAPVVALTDTGLSALRLQSGALSWEPLFEERSLLAGTGTFVPNLAMVQDLDGDRRADVLFPTREGAAVYLSGPDGLRREPASRVRFPLDDLQPEGGESLTRLYPLPEVRDVDGDELPDLVLRDPRQGSWQGFRVLRNLGGGRFAAPVSPLPPPPAPAPRRPGQPAPPPRPVVVWFGDVDGDGRAEYLTQQAEALPADAGFRKEMKNAKQPHFHLRLHHARPDLTMEPAAYRELDIEGYAFDGGDDGGNGGGGGDGGNGGFNFPGGLQDLNGDGRPDLVALTLDFSLFQALKVLTVQRISVDLDFHVWCQKADGGFQVVRGLDLSGNLNLNFRDLRPGQLSQFAGDFDGDGRPDFLQLGRGKAATVHRGRADCSFPAKPDLRVPLQEPPLDLSLAQVRDLDGDRKADLLIIQPQQRAVGGGVTPPVRLDLYLSGGAR